MWIGLLRAPRGRLSLRNVVTFAATLMVALLANLTIASSPAFAADGTWIDNETIEYRGASYDGPGTVQSGDEAAKELPVGTKWFGTRNSTNDKALLIYFSPAQSKGEEYLTATKANYISFDLKFEDSGDAIFSNASAPNPISLTPYVSPDAAAAARSATSCEIDGGLGWVICPLTQTLAGWMDTIYDIIAEFLAVRPLSTNTNNAMYYAWNQVRNLANLAFVGAFLIIIYSQVTGAGFTNYTLKKLLPRLIIAAVLVNISYWICAIALDVFNILGYGINDLFAGVRENLVATGTGDEWQPIKAAEVAAVILSGGAIGAASLAYAGTTAAAAFAGAGVAGLIAFFLPLVLGITFIVLMTLLILAARQAIIIILIVLAPLAFVAYLLPNTEKWFERWRSALFTLLLVFPAFSVVFGGAQLASAIILQNIGNANAGIMVLLALAVQVAPLAISPLLLKLGGGVLNRFSGVVNNPTKGVFDRGKNWANERRDDAIARGNRRLAAREQSGTLGRFGLNRTAYNRQRTNIRRQQERAANESISKGYFAQSEDGNRVHRLNERGKLEQGLGDNENQARWENEVRTTPFLADRAHRSHEAHNEADLHKRSVDSDGEEHWQNRLNADASLKAVQTGSYLSEGRAKLTEESMKNADERALQAQIASPGRLRDMKVQSDVNAAEAQMSAANVTAEGKQVFQNRVISTPSLKNLNTSTTMFEKQAESLQNTLAAQANAEWERTSRVDTNLQGIRLREVEATDTQKLAEAEWTSLVEGIRDKGGNARGLKAANRATGIALKQLAPDIVAQEKTTQALQSIVASKAEREFVDSSSGKALNIRSQAAQDTLEASKADQDALIKEWRTDKGAEGLTGQDAIVANELLKADIKKRVKTQRSGAAGRVSDIEYATKVQDDATGLAVDAGGVAGDTGVSQAKAIAKQTIIDNARKAVAAEETLLSNTKEQEILSDTMLGNPDILDMPDEKISAMGSTIAKRGHMESHIKLWKRMSELRKQAREAKDNAQTPDEVEAAQEMADKVENLQQIVLSEKSKKPFGVGDEDLGAATTGIYERNIFATSRDRLNSHVSVESMANADPDDFKMWYEMDRNNLLSPEQRNRLIDTYELWKTDPMLKGRLQPKHRNIMERIVDRTIGENDQFEEMAAPKFVYGLTSEADFAD